MNEKYKKIEKQIKFLNNLQNDESINTIFKITKEEDRDLLFDYVLEKSTIKAAELINKNIVSKDNTKKVLDKILNKEYSDETFKVLLYLDINNLKNYIESHNELKDVLLEKSSDMYNYFVKHNARYDLFLKYVYLCYFYTNNITSEITLFENAPIKNSKICEEIIIDTERLIYKNNDFTNLIKYSVSTQSIELLLISLEKPKNELIKLFEKEVPLYYLSYIFDIESNNSCDEFENYLSNKKNKDSYFARIYNYAKSIIKYGIIPNYKIKFNISNYEFNEEEEYIIFTQYVKVFNMLLNNINGLIEFIEKISVLKINPFLMKNIKYLNNNIIKEYLEKEKNIIIENAKIFSKNEKNIFLYFNTYIKYVISFDDYIKLITTNNSLFKIENTCIKGLIVFDKEEKQLFLEIDYDRLKISFSNPSYKYSVFSGLYVSAFISDYNKDTKCYIISHIEILYSKNLDDISSINKIKSNNKVINILYKAYKSEISDEELDIITDYKTLALINDKNINKDNNMPSKLFYRYCYYYAIYKDKFKDIEINIKEQLIEHESIEEDIFKKILYKYLYFYNKQETLSDLIQNIKKILNNYSSLNLDLLENDYYMSFKEEFNHFLKILEKTDINFKEEIINKLKEENLLSITYLNINSKYDEYFDYIKQNELIYNYYKLNNFNKNIVKESEIIKYLKIKECIDLLNKDKKHSLRTLKKDLSELKNIYFRNWINTMLQERLNKSDKIHVYKKIEWLEIINNKPEITYDNLYKSLITLEYESKINIEDFDDFGKLELSKKEIMSLQKPIINMIINNSINIELIYKILDKLGKNNPYNINNLYKINEYEKINLDILKRENEIYKIKKVKTQIDLFLKSPFYLIIPFNDFYKKLKIINNQKDICILFDKYHFVGKISVKTGENKIVKIKSLLLDESEIILQYKSFKNLKYKVIPNIDEVKFKIINIVKKYNKFKVIFELVDSFKEEENLYNKFVKDNSFFDTLDIESKKKLLRHMCRYNFYDTYKFDKNQILSEEEYTEILENIELYFENFKETVQYYLENNYLDRLRKYLKMYFSNNSFEYLKRIQKRVLDIQDELYKNNEYDLINSFYQVLYEIDYYDDILISLKVKSVLNHQFKYSNKSNLNNNFEEYKKNNYFEYMKLKLNTYKYSYDELGLDIFIDEYKKYVMDKNDALFLIYVIYIRLIRTKRLTKARRNLLIELNNYFDKEIKFNYYTISYDSLDKRIRELFKQINKKKR